MAGIARQGREGGGVGKDGCRVKVLHLETVPVLVRPILVLVPPAAAPPPDAPPPSRLYVKLTGMARSALRWGCTWGEMVMMGGEETGRDDGGGAEKARGRGRGGGGMGVK